MNNAPLSVLLLAWDDADPAPGMLGAPLAAGATLRAALAAQLPLTAILPQRPPSGIPPAADAADAPSGPGEPAPSAIAAPRETLAADADGLTTTNQARSAAAGAAAAPEKLLLPATREPAGATDLASPAGLNSAAPSAFEAPRPGAPVLVGLADLTLPELRAEARRWGEPEGRAGREPADGGRVPAAPYVGNSAPAPSRSLGPEATAATSSTASSAGQGVSLTSGAPIPFLAASDGPDETQSDGAAAEPTALEISNPQAPVRDGERPTPPHATAAFEVGADPVEAAELTPGEDVLALVVAAAPGALPGALAMLRRPAAPDPEPGAAGSEPAAPLPPEQAVPASPKTAAAAASLSFRVIQYARFATQLTAGAAGVGVIFAAAWPTWLAAVEIRQRTGRPLVLAVAALPSDYAPGPVRGWLHELERQALRRAELVLASTAALAQRLHVTYQLAQVPRVVPAVGGDLSLGADCQALADELRGWLLPADGAPA